jgi:hypothetical protein
MDKVQKYNSFNTNTPSSESYRNYFNEEFYVAHGCISIYRTDLGTIVVCSIQLKKCDDVNQLCLNQ